MGRVPEEELERLKREVPVVSLVEARGVELKRHGADMIGLCPFHEDHEPSLVVTPEKNLWHCLGACQAGGTVIDWVMKAEGVSFRHAVELLRTKVALRPASVTNEASAKKSAVRKLEPLVAVDADDQAALGEVVGYYHKTLKASPEALAYLEGRGLGSAEMVEHFRLGFANRTLGYRLPAMQSAAGRAIRGRLQRLGVLRESGHEHFWGSVVVPLFDEGGRVAGMYGRKIAAHLMASMPRHMYLPGARRGVFNAECFAESKTVILCEALMDGRSPSHRCRSRRAATHPTGQTRENDASTWRSCAGLRCGPRFRPSSAGEMDGTGGVMSPQGPQVCQSPAAMSDPAATQTPSGRAYLAWLPGNAQSADSSASRSFSAMIASSSLSPFTLSWPRCSSVIFCRFAFSSSVVPAFTH